MTWDARRVLLLKSGEMREGAPIENLLLCERRLGANLPSDVRELYRISDGMQFSHTVEVNSLNKALEWLDALREHPWRYYPLADGYDSDPLCVCCATALTGYVVHVYHDDAAELRFRCTENLLEALWDFAHADGYDLHTLPSDFKGRERTTQDRLVGHELLKMATQLREVDRLYALRFAITLLSEEEVEDIAALLRDSDTYVREDAERRLRGMTDPRAQRAVKAFECDMEEFIAQCAKALWNAGLNATIERLYGRPAVRIDPGPIWPNLAFYYSRRDQPDVFSELVERTKVFIDEAERKKRHG
jgi:cell wall assembly regulator SMI1